MTYQELYSNIIEPSVQQEISKIVHDVEKLDIDINISDDLIELIKQLTKAKTDYEHICQYQEPSISIDCTQKIKEIYSDIINEYNSKYSKLIKEKGNEIQIVLDNHRNEIRIKEQEIEARKKIVSEKYSSLVSNNMYIISKKNDIEDIFKLYNMPFNTVAIDTDKMSFEELEEVFEISKIGLSSTIVNTNVIDRLLGLMYYPLDREYKTSSEEMLVKTVYLICLIILFFGFKPYFMGVVGIVYIAAIFAKASNIQSRKSLLQLAYSLTKLLDITRFIDEDLELKNLYIELEKIKSRDLNKNRIDIENKYSRLLDELEKINPMIELNRDLMLYNTHIQDISNLIESRKMAIEGTLKRIKNNYDEFILMATQTIEDISSKIVPLGTSIKECNYLDMKVKLGRIMFEDKICSEVEQELALENILFTYKTIEEKESQLDFMKLLLVNMLSNIIVRNLRVTIYDRDGLGRDFADFYDTECYDFINVKTDKFKDIMSAYTKEGEANTLKFKRNDINTYNKECDKEGKITEKYNLLIVLSTEEAIHTDKDFSAFFKRSATLGTIVWVLHKDVSLYEDRDFDDVQKFMKDKSISTKPMNIKFSNHEITSFTTDIIPIRYTEELGSTMMNTYKRMLEEYKPKPVMYEEKYAERYFPEDKIWTHRTLKGIELNFGLLDGDPYKANTIMLGDQNVHCVMVGQTGAGKSATINQIISSLIRKYPPEQLELVMVDFKNIEFRLYTGDLLIPHAKIIAGTKDGEYAISIFDYLIAEMNRRTELMAKYKFQKIEEFNRAIYDGLINESILPRILVSMDEFQVMFTEVDDKSLEIIKKRITSVSKLARFCGCHLFFTSQSMKGTMSQDILDQFSLRAALSCSKDTSNDIIGNDAASLLPRLGFIVTNTTGGSNKLANKTWRVPLLTNDDIKVYLPKLIKKCSDDNHINRQAVFYNEDEMFKEEALLKVYRENDQIVSDRYLMILGERTTFSLNRAPENFIFKRDDCEHVLVCGFNRSDLMNIAQTFITNIKVKQDASLIIHSADKDAITLIGLENKVDDKFLPYLDTQLTAYDIIEAIESMIENRLNKQGNDFKPVYIVCLYWDKIVGLGRSDDFKLQERFKAVLQKSSMLDIHLIVCVKETKMFRTFKSLFNHTIAAYCDDMDSMTMLDNAKASKINKPLAIYKFGQTTFKFKIYQYEVSGKVEARTLVL